MLRGPMSHGLMERRRPGGRRAGVLAHAWGAVVVHRSASYAFVQAPHAASWDAGISSPSTFRNSAALNSTRYSGTSSVANRIL